VIIGFSPENVQNAAIGFDRDIAARAFLAMGGDNGGAGACSAGEGYPN